MRAEFQEGFSVVGKVWPNVTTNGMHADFQEGFMLVENVWPNKSTPQ